MSSVTHGTGTGTVSAEHGSRVEWEETEETVETVETAPPLEACAALIGASPSLYLILADRTADKEAAAPMFRVGKDPLEVTRLCALQQHMGPPR